MRKLYLHFTVSFLLCLFAGQTWAQSVGSIYLGHCKYDDYIYPYDGLSLQYDSRVGVGMKLTRDMFEDYIGGKITAIRCGWDDEASSATYDCFIRLNNFNGETVATGRRSVRFGWNEVPLTTPYVIPEDVDTICVGFYTDVKKDVCSIPKLYPTNIKNSCFLFNNETDENGNEFWYDSRNLGIMPIMLKISDSEGKFADMLKCSNVTCDHIVNTDIIAGVFKLANTGSNNINKLKITTTFGEQTYTEEVSLLQAMAPTTTKNYKLPIRCFGTGLHKVTFEEINGNTPKTLTSMDLNLVGVPKAVSDKYTHMPLIEFFMSENSYQVPQYFDQVFLPGYDPFAEKMNVVCQHTDDKYMIGEPDEAIRLHLGLVNNDSMSVFLPDVMINRTAYVGNPIGSTNYPIHMGVLYPSPVQEAYYNDIIAHPTFASINVKANLDENGENVLIEVSGNVAENILPEGESLHLTVYLMENEVESYDQRFWDDKEGAVVSNKYIHYNIIRENLTPLWGKKLTNASGDYKMNFTAEVYEEYNKANLSVIAFLNRGGDNKYNERQIINSKEALVSTDNTGIDGVITDESKEPTVWYDMMGRRVLQPTKGGVYIKNGKKVLVK